MSESNHFFCLGDNDEVVENVEFTGEVQGVSSHHCFVFGGVGNGLAIKDFQFVLEIFVLLFSEGVVAFLSDFDKELLSSFERSIVRVFWGQFFEVTVDEEMILEESVQWAFEAIVNCDVGFGVGDGFVVVDFLLGQFGLGKCFFEVKLFKVVSEIGFDASEFFGIGFLEFFIQGFDLGFVFKVFEVDFVVADYLVEFLSNHDVSDSLSFVGRNNLNHGVAHFEDFFKVREKLVGFGLINQFVLDHLGFNYLNGCFDVFIVGDLGFEPFFKNIHAVLCVFLLLDEVFGLDYQKSTLRAVERILLEFTSFMFKFKVQILVANSMANKVKDRIDSMQKKGQSLLSVSLYYLQKLIYN